MTNWDERRPVYESVKAFLRERHPVLFSADDPKPLLLGIRKSIKAVYPELSWTQVNTFLKFWCRRKEYHRAVAYGDLRYGLNGETEAIWHGHKEHGWRWGRKVGEENPLGDTCKGSEIYRGAA